MISSVKRVLGPAGFVVLGICSVGAAPISSVDAAASPSPDVKIKGMAFSAPALRVKAGMTVTWTNTDQVPHNVVAKDGSFRSKFLTMGESFSFKFTKKGEYAYYCAIHPQMVAKIIVT